MENLDLDINNYSIKDIEKFLHLSPKTKYTADDVEEKEYQLREQLLKSGHVNKRFKRDLIEFLEKAKNWLIFVKCNPGKTQQPTTIPTNYKLDNLDTPTSKEAMSRTEELIVRPNKAYLYTQNSDYFPGVLNPLNQRTLNKYVNIDTRYRENLYTTQSSDFTLQLPIKINKVVSMQLTSVEIPVAFYGISSNYGNNFLYIKAIYASFTDAEEFITDETVVIYPDGNYSATDFVDTLNALICPINVDNTVKYPNSIFSYIHITLDINGNGSGSGKVTISPTGTYAENIKEIILDFTRDIHGKPDIVPISTKMGWNLGFTKQMYLGKNTYTADTIIEPATVRYIYLVVDEFNNSSNNHFISASSKSILTPNILARIAIKGSYFSLLMENDYNVVSEPRTYFGPIDIQKLRIRLLDEHGRTLDMNNANYSFCLLFKILYDL